jgi:hypothetical protein
MSDSDAALSRIDRHRRAPNMFAIGPITDDIRCEVAQIVREAAARRYGVAAEDVTGAQMDSHMQAEQDELREFARELGW